MTKLKKATESDNSDLGLGQFVDCFDSASDPTPSKPIIGLGCSIILFAFSLIIPIYIAVSEKMPEVLWVILGSVIWLLLIRRGVWLLRRERVYVSNVGFVWQVLSRKGVVKQQDKVEFKEVSGIACPKTRAYNNGRYNHTSFKLSVYSKDDSLMTDIKGVYYAENESEGGGNWKCLALRTIMDKWFEHRWKQISNELHSKGCAQFVDPKSKEKITISKNYIQKGNNTIYRDGMRYGFNNGELLIRADGCRDIVINVNKMINSQLFLYSINYLLGIK